MGLKTLIALGTNLGLWLISLATSVVWWRLWMNEGWIGTPRVLHRLFWCDGEGCYDLTLYEMQIIAALFWFAVAGAAFLCIRRWVPTLDNAKNRQ